MEGPSLMSMPSLKPDLARASPSFRLRSPSLNIVRLCCIFDLFDRNGDFEIIVEELHGALDRLGIGSDAAEISPLCPISPLAVPDSDSRTCRASTAPSPTRSSGRRRAAMAAEENIVEVFYEDGDGFISAKELQAVLRKLGLQECDSTVGLECDSFQSGLECDSTIGPNRKQFIPIGVVSDSTVGMRRNSIPLITVGA